MLRFNIAWPCTFSSRRSILTIGSLVDYVTCAVRFSPSLHNMAITIVNTRLKAAQRMMMNTYVKCVWCIELYAFTLIEDIQIRYEWKMQIFTPIILQISIFARLLSLSIKTLQVNSRRKTNNDVMNFSKWISGQLWLYVGKCVSTWIWPPKMHIVPQVLVCI